MTPSMLDRMELAALAHGRYPDVELPMAILFFQSDRRRAGLGALDESRRRGGAQVSNVKRYELAHNQVRYHLVRKTLGRHEYAKPTMDEFGWSRNVASLTVQRVFIPPRTEHLCLPTDIRDFRDQTGRRRVAYMLRKARRQLRKALEESASVRNLT